MWQCRTDDTSADSLVGTACDESTSTLLARAKRTAAAGEEEKKFLPTFHPGPYSVIIGREPKNRGAIGNRRLKVLASTFLNRYSKASKGGKSKIVAQVVATIKEACPVGAFVRSKKFDGRWYEVAHAVASEKVGYTMRELLGDQYKSSSKSKARRRPLNVSVISNRSDEQHSESESAERW